MTHILRTAAFATAALAAGPALAHVGAHVGAHAGPAGLAAGFAHPFAGLDHVLAMVAVGIYAAQSGGRALWLYPLTFMAVMAAGGLLGAKGLALPGIELGIAASVLVLGLLIAAAFRLPSAAAAVLVGAFALVHGHAHGAEMGAGSLALYGAGFLAATALLHGVGVAAGLGLRDGWKPAVRVAGLLIAAAGLPLLA